MHEHLVERGFQLWRFSHQTHHAESRPSHWTRREVLSCDGREARFAAGNGRLFRVDALYFRDHRIVSAAPDGARRLRTLAALLDAAGEADAAWACLESA